MPVRRQGGGKVPLPGAHANAPPGGVRRLTLAGLGWAPRPFTRRTISAVSAANECEGITCLWQVTRNGSDEAERSERSPPGAARNAGDEGLAAAGGQVSGEAAPANGSASQVNVSSEASGEVRRAIVALRSHPQAANPVLTTLRAPCMFLRSKVVTLRAALPVSNAMQSRV